MATDVLTRIGGKPPGLGDRALPERIAARNISEAFRGLRDPMEIGRALLDVFDGKDPAKRRSKDNPDGLPIDYLPIDMSHRLAAVKLYLEYGYGKPLQGVAIQAMVEHRLGEAERPLDLRSSALPPSVAEALVLIARAVLAGDEAPAPQLAPAP